MHLLKLDSRGEPSLTADLIKDIPPYAILSHTWEADKDEVTFNDLKNGSGKSKAGFDKIRFCGEQASRDDLQYFWVDTCCIDKANLTELSEAITSMFHWYRDAVTCYVYLSDVSVRTDDCSHTERGWKPAFRKSRWFTRGWTLQELIAPGSVKFFSREGECLGNKGTLALTIHEITKIPIDVLNGAPLSEFSVDERQRWAEKRETKRREDKAYCLLGIFDVSMSLRYGEGDNAFIRLKKKIDKLSGSELDEGTMKSLNDFKITDPEEDIKRIELSKDRLLEDCYKWILQDPNFQAWHGTDAIPLLWINGHPGKGKTMLMIALVRELLNDIRKDSSAVTFFFCQSTDIRLNNAASILRGLIWKLATDHPQLAIHIRDKYKSDKQVLNGPNAIISLFTILSAMLDNCPRTFLLIDALDECNSGVERDQLLDLIIEHAKSSSKAKWLLASRNYPEIKQRLETESRMLNLELNEQHISNAIAAFIELKTSNLAKTKKYNSDLKEKVKKELTRKADSTFLWVALACKSLLDSRVTRRKTLSTLEKLPSGLEKLYTRMMEQVLQSEDEEDRDFCLQILRSVCLAFRPLSTEELIPMTELPTELMDDDDGLSELIELCGSFIIVRERMLYFVHQSAKDYLVGDGAQKLFTAGFQQDHGLVVGRSLDAMSRTLKRDMCNLRYPGSPPSKAKIHTRLRAISYACSFWVEHLANYLNHFTDGLRYEEYFMDRGRVYEFLLKHLLHWFEALSLIGELDRGITGLHSLEQMIGDALKKCPGVMYSSHNSFLHDAIRVFRQFRPAVEVAPLQVYCSVLIFSPENSLVRQNFQHEKPRWISPLPRIQTEWSSCLQTLEGHSSTVSSVTFSPDSQQLASASEDHTVRLWNAVTGACQHTLEGHSGAVFSLTFSPDGKQLVSASEDHTMRLWDAVTGICQRTLESHSGAVFSLTFSPDGKQLASASEDHTVRLWDAVTGICQRTLEGHSGAVFFLTFSPDGKQLTSASEDHTVRLWDVVTEACQRTLEGHTSAVSVTFSPDGQQLASASEDHTVRLWNAVTGVCQRTLEGHSDAVFSLTFSPDGQQLASASEDHTVRLWNAVTGICQRTLEGHSGAVFSLTFSPDGKQLAWASEDHTVRLWDAVTGPCQHTLKGHSGDVFSVTFSPDGKQLASASEDHTVRLWDAVTGPCQHTLEGHSDHSDHSDAVFSLTFSLDGQQLASASWDRTVRLWNAVTGACQHTLEGHSDQIRFVVFSPDGQQLASASWDRTVRLWNAVTGARQHTLEGHSDQIRFVAFSPDGQQLASVSWDRTVRLWNAATGACQHTLEGHTNTIVFNANGSNLVTDFGSFSARRSKSDNAPNQAGFSIASQKYITWNGDDVLWLPPEYRPVCSVAKENRIGVGCGSGLVYILNFCPENLPR